MSNYPAYPYHQELGELEAICRLDQAARDAFDQMSSGHDIYPQAISWLTECKARFDSVAMGDNPTDYQIELAQEFNVDYIFAVGILRVLGPMPPSDRQRYLAHPRTVERMRELAEHYEQLLNSAKDRRDTVMYQLDAEYGG